MSGSDYFVEVDNIPKRLKNYSSPSICKIIIEQFLKSNANKIKLNTKNIELKFPYEAFRQYIKKNKASNIKVFQRRSDIYLQKIQT
jgi:hypothetical protein